MPEGDTIWRTAEALRQRLLHQQVLEARPGSLSELEELNLVGVRTHGKHLLMDFTNSLSLHSHMGMTGSWHLYQPGESWRKPTRLANAELVFSKTVAVLFEAPVVELAPTQLDRLEHLGPDVLVTPLNFPEILRRARSSASPTLGELLLDQTVCAGIGNIYKCEGLWATCFDPWQGVSETHDGELEALYQKARAMMRESLTRHGFRKNAVHGRAGRPCPRCQRRIEVRAQGERLPRQTFYCPNCQT